MGSARERSWSLSRSRLFQECPRAFWFNYYGEGEPERPRIYALKDLATIPIAAGKVVDHVVSHALKAFREKGVVRSQMGDAGVKFFRKQVERSLTVVPEIRNGGRSDRAANQWMPPLQHHYYEYPMDDQLPMMEERIHSCLSTFETGEVWPTIRSVPTDGWHPIGRLDEGEIPSFTTRSGLKVWASIDFAMRWGAQAHVLDWKSGFDGQRAREEADEQLTLYACWAKGVFKVSRESVLVQAIWLQGGAAWKPSTVSQDAVKKLANRIESESADEEDLLRIRRNAYGRPIQILADREKFPPKPGRPCLQCRFRELCSEGQKQCSNAPGHAVAAA